MGKSKRVNPHRRPATVADVNRAKREAQGEAVCMAWAIMFSVLRDKEGWGKTRLRRLWDEVEYLSESINAGFVNVHDLVHTLEDEAGIYLTGVNGNN